MNANACILKLLGQMNMQWSMITWLGSLDIYMYSQDLLMTLKMSYQNGCKFFLSIIVSLFSACH